MANTIILKKSSVAGKIPLVGDLVYGELAVNYADGLLYYKTITPVTVNSINSGTSNTIVYQESTGTTGFIAAPVSADTYLHWTGSAFDWAAVSGGPGGGITAADVYLQDLFYNN
jgi:hypothetical protein